MSKRLVLRTKATKQIVEQRWKQGRASLFEAKLDHKGARRVRMCIRPDIMPLGDTIVVHCADGQTVLHN